MRRGVEVAGDLVFGLLSWWEDVLCDTLTLHRRMWQETYPGRREYRCFCYRCGLQLRRTRGGWWV